MMRIFYYILLIIIIGIGITFAFLNAQTVEVNYYIGKFQLSLSLLIALVLGIGLIIGLIFSCIVFLKLKKENFSLKRRLKLADKEIANLRTMPVKESIV